MKNLKEEIWENVREPLLTEYWDTTENMQQIKDRILPAEQQQVHDNLWINIYNSIGRI